MVIKETENFILGCYTSEILHIVNYVIFAKNKDGSNYQVASINNGLEKRTAMMTTETFQNTITTWELFKEFIMLVDEAYDLLRVDKGIYYNE